MMPQEILTWVELIALLLSLDSYVCLFSVFSLPSLTKLYFLLFNISANVFLEHSSFHTMIGESVVPDPLLRLSDGERTAHEWLQALVLPAPLSLQSPHEGLGKDLEGSNCSTSCSCLSRWLAPSCQ